MHRHVQSAKDKAKICRAKDLRHRERLRFKVQIKGEKNKANLNEIICLFGVLIKVK